MAARGAPHLAVCIGQAHAQTQALLPVFVQPGTFYLRVELSEPRGIGHVHAQPRFLRSGVRAGDITVEGIRHGSFRILGQALAGGKGPKTRMPHAVQHHRRPRQAVVHLLARQIITRANASEQLLSDVPLHLLLHTRRDFHLRQLTKQHQIDDVSQIKDLAQFRLRLWAKSLDCVISQRTAQAADEIRGHAHAIASCVQFGRIQIAIQCHECSFLPLIGDSNFGHAWD